MISIALPNLFNQKFLFQYLRRSINEITFQVTDNDTVFKLFPFGEELILVKITFSPTHINIDFPQKTPTTQQSIQIEKYIKEWFDLETELTTFYQKVHNDRILVDVITKFHGLRMVKAPELFEALSWSIIGQQINLPFAYSCKKALVEKAGLNLNFKENTYYTFPEPSAILKITDLEFRKMKFSGQKVKYIRGVAIEIMDGSLSKEQLGQMEFEDAKKRLTKIKGVGNWSANYVLMRCLNFKEAFPIEDVGLHNALKRKLNLTEKPTLKEITTLSKNWKGWEAYATFYLWQSLLPL